jgi:predicted amidohydrolase
MSRRLTVACVQTRADIDPAVSLNATLPLIRSAAADGAHYIQTPEMTNLLQPHRPTFFDTIVDEANDPTLATCREEARRLGVCLHLGSLAIRGPDGKALNRAFVIAPTGDIVARYDKIHMFDVDLPNGQTYRESAAYSPGEAAVVAPIECGGIAARLGVTICYDLRFPGLFQDLARNGAEILAIPSSFTVPTGQAHWHVLMRARAIETGCFVIAAAQGGTHACGRETYGHSLVVSPWGEVIAEAAHDNPGIVLATIDLDEVAATRARIPSLANARAYRLGAVQ